MPGLSFPLLQEGDRLFLVFRAEDNVLGDIPRFHPDLDNDIFRRN